MSQFGDNMLRLQGAIMRRMPGMLTCAQFDQFISDYLEACLPQKQRKIFERHLGMCPKCRDYLRAYQSTIELERNVLTTSDAPPPEDAPEDLIRAILAARPTT